MNQNLLSIITPVYQVEQYLPQCLDSIGSNISALGIDFGGRRIKGPVRRDL